MFFVLGLIVCMASVGAAEETSTCTYPSTCPSNFTIGQPCNRFPPCRTITVNLPCLKTDDCIPSYDVWSDCTQACNGGLRTRIGRCCSANCARIVSETEVCNESPCA